MLPSKRVLTFYLLALITASGACVGTGGSASSNDKQATDQFAELKAKQHLQQTFNRSVDVQVSYVTPFRQLENRDGGFVLPAGISYSDSGGLYITDNNAQRIHYWPSDANNDTILTPERGKGQLKFPDAVQFVDGNVFVSDNDGIKVFSPTGGFQRLIRPYFGIFSFVKSKKSIFANTLVRNATVNDPLIVEFDETGRESKGIGVRRNIPDHNGLEDQAFITVSSNLLLAAFKYRPYVEVYDIDSGKLVRNFEIVHPVFRDLAGELERRRGFATRDVGRISLPRYISGIRALGTRIFLCLALPEPEIWEIDQSGTAVNQVRVSGLPPAVDIFGFDVRSRQDRILFSLGIIDQGWKTTVSELESGFK